jgi:hypothetical protein
MITRVSKLTVNGRYSDHFRIGKCIIEQLSRQNGYLAKYRTITTLSTLSGVFFRFFRLRTAKLFQPFLTHFP